MSEAIITAVKTAMMATFPDLCTLAGLSIQLINGSVR
jgi:hypothetical protein